jgi:2-dehydropantoate 2-reductase
MLIPPSEIQIYSTTEEMGKASSFDWVILALKSTAMPHIPTLLKPLLHNQTRVLAIMNGLIDHDLVQSLRNTSTNRELPCAAIYGGMAFIGCNRLSFDLVEHTDQGALSAGLAASFADAATNSHQGGLLHDMEALVDLWRPTKVKFIEETCLIRGRWIKNCWNLPFNSISCAMGGILTIDIIVKDPSLRKLADDIMDETIAIANADLASHGIDASLYLDDTVVREKVDTESPPQKTHFQISLNPRLSLSCSYVRN